jgi:outer membrane lipoprotein-sorting protein
VKRGIVLGLLLFAALATSACGATPTAAPTPAPPPTVAATRTAAPTVTAAPTATQTSAPTTTNPLDALTRIFHDWASVKTFHAKIVVTPKTGASTETDLDVVMPDRFHVKTPQLEAIVIGPTYYVKVANQWQKIALPQGIDLNFADVKKLEAELGASTDVKLIGPDMLNGTPTLVYQYTATITTPTPLTMTSKVWVAVSDQLPRKMESVDTDGAMVTVTYSNYNAPITIEPPIN